MSKRAEEAALKAYQRSDFQSVETARKTKRKCYIAGYQQAHQDLIDKACDALFDMLPIIVSYYNEDIHEHADRSDFIKAFRKRMEEEL